MKFIVNVCLKGRCLYNLIADSIIHMVTNKGLCLYITEGQYIHKIFFKDIESYKVTPFI